MSAQPDVRIRDRSPVGTGDHDTVFADMARAHRLPGTEVHVTCMPDTDGRLTHIEYRSTRRTRALADSRKGRPSATASPSPPTERQTREGTAAASRAGWQGFRPPFIAPGSHSRDPGEVVSRVAGTIHGRLETVSNTYTAILERDGDWYVAYCPEVPGANGQGRTKEEARTSLACAIELIFQDRREDAMRYLPDDAERDTVVVG